MNNYLLKLVYSEWKETINKSKIWKPNLLLDDYLENISEKLDLAQDKFNIKCIQDAKNEIEQLLIYIENKEYIASLQYQDYEWLEVYLNSTKISKKDWETMPDSTKNTYIRDGFEKLTEEDFDKLKSQLYTYNIKITDIWDDLVLLHIKILFALKEWKECIRLIGSNHSIKPNKLNNYLIISLINDKNLTKAKEIILSSRSSNIHKKIFLLHCLMYIYILEKDYSTAYINAIEMLDYYSINKYTYNNKKLNKIYKLLAYCSKKLNNGEENKWKTLQKYHNIKL